jgi:hypothetical protein
MNKIGTVLGLIPERGGVITVSSTAGIYFNNAIGMKPLVLRRLIVNSPMFASGDFLYKKHVFPRFTQELLWLQLHREDFYGRGEMRLLWAYL